MPSPSYVPVAQNRKVYAALAADSPPVTGTTVQTATTLQVPVEAGMVYTMSAGLICALSNAAATLGIGWTGPAGATMKWNSSTGSTNYRPTIASVDSYTGSASTRLALFAGRLIVGPTAGFLTVTISTSDVAQTASLFQDSWVQLDRVS